MRKDDQEKTRNHQQPDRRTLLLGGTAIVAATLTSEALAQAQKAAPAAAPATTSPSDRKPNILVIFGDDIGVPQISAYTMGLMGYRTPNIDRIANEGAIFTDAYGQQSCTAGRASSSWARSRSAPVFSPSACRAIPTASRTGCRPSPMH